jgi:hypothetical protein
LYSPSPTGYPGFLEVTCQAGLGGQVGGQVVTI